MEGGWKKSQGNIFSYSKRGQSKPNSKLAQERELDQAEDPEPACTEQCSGFNYKTALPRTTAKYQVCGNL